MAWLSTRLAPAFHAATAFSLSAGKAIGGRRLRRSRRVLLPQGQLTFQLGDLFLGLRDLLRFLGDLLRLFGDVSIAFGQFAAKPINFVLQALRSVLAARALWPRHPPHGTPIGSICTAP